VIGSKAVYKPSQTQPRRARKMRKIKIDKNPLIKQTDCKEEKKKLDENQASSTSSDQQKNSAEDTANSRETRHGLGRTAEMIEGNKHLTYEQDHFHSLLLPSDN
jgi:hypothetical protein